MADIRIVRAHTLTQVEARRRVLEMVDRLEREGISGQRFSGRWTGDRYEFDRPATGTVLIGGQAIDVQIHLPFFFSFLRDEVERQVGIELDRVLA
jgi:putative polyhydroxyalkanoate system protein